MPPIKPGFFIDGGSPVGVTFSIEVIISLETQCLLVQIVVLEERWMFPLETCVMRTRGSEPHFEKTKGSNCGTEKDCGQKGSALRFPSCEILCPQIQGHLYSCRAAVSQAGGGCASIWAEVFSLFFSASQSAKIWTDAGLPPPKDKWPKAFLRRSGVTLVPALNPILFSET